MSKINLFQDKEYEELNWLNRAIEPFVFPLNDIIAQIPDRVDFHYADIVQLITDNVSLMFNKDWLIERVMKQHGIAYGDDDVRTMSNFLDLEVVGNGHIDFEKGEMDGYFSLVKKKPQLDDDDIKNWIVEQSNKVLDGIYSSDRSDLGRMNEIMDILNCKELRSSRSVRKKHYEIIATFSKIIQEDTWRIRNADLAVKCAIWAKEYIIYGNLASLSNFTRIKCMTHKGLSIYSMEETK